MERYWNVLLPFRAKRWVKEWIPLRLFWLLEHQRCNKLELRRLSNSYNLQHACARKLDLWWNKGDWLAQSITKIGIELLGRQKSFLWKIYLFKLFDISKSAGDHAIFSLQSQTRYTSVWREELLYPSSTAIAEVGGTLSLFLGISFMTDLGRDHLHKETCFCFDFRLC